MKSLLRNFLIFDVPLLIIISQILVEIFVPDAEKPAFHSEGGPHEIMQVLILCIALPTAIYLFCKAPSKWLRLWTGTAVMCCFYVLGEEVSWGQWLFFWDTPEQWARLNDQGETNFHNTSAWLDQKPRILLEVGVLVGGIIIPALRHFKPEKLPAKFSVIYPGNEVVFTALLALVVKISEQFKINGKDVFWRASEVIELYLYYFVMLYLIYLIGRWKREKVIS